MKQTQLKQIIREEIAKVLREADSFGDDIEKQIRAGVLDDKRAFQAWAKAQAAKKKIEGVNFGGRYQIIIAINKLEERGIITSEILNKWKHANPESKEAQLYRGLGSLVAAVS